jgi:hypothetical protein
MGRATRVGIAVALTVSACGAESESASGDPCDVDVAPGGEEKLDPPLRDQLRTEPGDTIASVAISIDDIAHRACVATAIEELGGMVRDEVGRGVFANLPLSSLGQLVQRSDILAVTPAEENTVPPGG